MDAAREAWTSAIRVIAGKQQGSLDLWLGQVECMGLEDGELLLRVPNEFTREWITERYLGQILEKMRKDVPSVGSVSFLLDSAAFAGRILEKTGVVLTPGVGFGPEGEGYARIALCRDVDRLSEAMQRIVNS